MQEHFVRKVTSKFYLAKSNLKRPKVFFFFFKLGSYPHFTANKVSSATVGLGRFLSPHVKKGGTALLTRYYGCQEAEACHTMDSVLTVGAGAVEGIGAVSTGLEVAGAVLGRSLSDSTVKIVRHK